MAELKNVHVGSIQARRKNEYAECFGGLFDNAEKNDPNFCELQAVQLRDSVTGCMTFFEYNNYDLVPKMCLNTVHFDPSWIFVWSKIFKPNEEPTGIETLSKYFWP